MSIQVYNINKTVCSASTGGMSIQMSRINRAGYNVNSGMSIQVFNVNKVSCSVSSGISIQTFKLNKTGCSV